jgi:D-arabinose 5-phosphate isomerase GutQ
MLDINEIARDVALRNGTLLGKDDPILISVSINEKIIRHYTDILIADQIDRQKTLAVTIERHSELSKEAASVIVTKAVEAVREQAVNATRQTAELIGENAAAKVRTEAITLQRELEQFRSSFFNQIRTIQWLIYGLSMLIAALFGMWFGMRIF